MKTFMKSTVAATALSLVAAVAMAQSSGGAGAGSSGSAGSPGAAGSVQSSPPGVPAGSPQGSARTGSGMGAGTSGSGAVGNQTSGTDSGGRSAPSQQVQGGPVRPGETGSIAQPQAITPQQRTSIRQTIVQTHVKPAANVTFAMTVGTVVPQQVELHDLPPRVVEVVPAYRGYRFVLVGDDIVVIDPASRRIVAVITA